MKAYLCSQPGWISWPVRFACWSQWSHIAVVEDDGHVIHSTFFGRGVHRQGTESFLRQYPLYELISVPVPDEAAALAFLRAQVGKPYDWTSILGFIFRRDWAEEDAWTCSELFEAALIAGGLARFRVETSRITPQHQWMLEPVEICAGSGS